MLTLRKSAYLWVTHLSGVLAGEDRCQFAPWVKAHYTYEKRVDEDGGEALSRWMAEHDRLMTARAAELRAAGWTVMEEAQNKITVRGRTTVAGQPDLVAVKGKTLLVSDAKGGARKGKYIWQIREYLALLPLAPMAFKKGRRLVGELVYPDGRVEITLEAGDETRIFAQIRASGEGPEPPTTPSARECRYCDISECPDRFVGEALEGSAGGRF